MSKAYKFEGAWVAHRLEMLMSPAWQAAPRALKALLEIIEIEHLRHKGCANGSLFVSYRQFEAAGFNRRTVSEMLRIGERLGLIRINRETGVKAASRFANIRDSSCYLLTYLPTGEAKQNAPSDDWKRIKSMEAAEAIVKNTRAPQKRNSTIPFSKREAA